MMKFLLFCLLFPTAVVAQSSAPGYGGESLAGQLRANHEDRGRHEFPLYDTIIDIEVTGGLAHAVIKQVFVNDTDVNLEAFYAFPLPAKSAITDMRLLFKDREVHSVVREKQEALKVYTEAKASGRKTALLEKQTGHLFTTRVANFRPAEEVTVQFSFVFPLSISRELDGLYELHFPTTFTKPYLPVIEPDEPVFDTLQPLTSKQPFVRGPFAADRATNRVVSVPRVDHDNPHMLQFSLRVRGLDSPRFESVTHDLDVVFAKDGSAKVGLAGVYDLPNRDLVIRIQPSLGELPEASVLHSTSAVDTHGLVTLLPPAPPFIENLRVPREVVFLIDTSGSMEGDPIQQAKEGLKECLAMLEPTDRFNIVRFSSDYSSLADGFLEAEPARLEEALYFVRKLRTGGGTEMQTALSHVLNMPREQGYLRLVVFLTDGAVGSELSLQRLLQNQLDEARLFTFGVGAAPNAYLMEKMAELGRGESFFLRHGEDIAAAMSDFFHTVKQPVMTDISVEWQRHDGGSVDDLLVFPTRLPDLYAKRPLQLVYRDTRPFEGDLIVRGRLAGSPVEYSFPVTSANVHAGVNNSPGIDTLFGQSYVDERLDDWTAAPIQTKRDEIRADIVDAALAYNLVTRFTSRVAVEKRPAKWQAPSPDLSVKVPVMHPENLAYPATASDDPGKLLLGAVMVLLGFYLVVIDRKRLRT